MWVLPTLWKKQPVASCSGSAGSVESVDTVPDLGC
jgi:hypothetical protein